MHARREKTKAVGSRTVGKWGILVIASPFLQSASERFDVTLVAKPYALDLQARFWPKVVVIPFVAPWTAFKHKYRLSAGPGWT